MNIFGFCGFVPPHVPNYSKSSCQFVPNLFSMWSFNLISFVVSNVPWDVVPHSSHVSSKCDPWFYPNDTLWPNVLYVVVPMVLMCPWILFHLLCQMFLVPVVHTCPANMFLTLSKCIATCSQCSIVSPMLFPLKFHYWT